MIKTDIKRVKVSGNEEEMLDELQELNQLVLEEAKTILEYTQNVEKEAAVNDGFLAVAQKLGLEILDWKDVLQYKLEERHKAEQEVLQNRLAENKPLTANNISFPSWVATPISKYKKPIPSHILQKAVEIKRELPQAKIEIHSLEENPDPFLVVRVPDSRYANYDWYDLVYYIDYWDEPHFKTI